MHNTLRRLVALVAVAACADVSQSGSPLELGNPPDLRIQDANHNSGNPHFYWLRPLPVDNPSPTGSFDGNQLAVVQVCRLVGDACQGPPVVSFSTANGEVKVAGEKYQVQWDTRESLVLPSENYRVAVLVQGLRLGFLDVQIVRNNQEAKNLNSNEIVPLVDGHKLLIHFRIESGIFPLTIVPVGGDGQAAIIGTTLQDPLQVRVSDASGYPAEGVSVGFAALMGGGAVTATAVLTDGSGVAQASWTLGPAIGMQTASATQPAAAGSPVLFGAVGMPAELLLPEVILDTDQHFLLPGEISVLVWSATNATSCSAEWTGSTATSGSQPVSPANTTTYTIACTGAGGSASANTTVNIVHPVPQVSLDTEQHFLLPGETSVLVWNATNASSCSADWTTGTATSGSQPVSPANTTTYAITCTGGGGTASASTTINIVHPAPQLALSTDQHFLLPGEVSVLVWNATGVTSCSAVWTGSTAANGSQSVSPATTTTYTMTCTGEGGSISASTTVNVVQPAPEVTLVTDQHFLLPGEISVLVWNATGVTSCSAGWTASTATTGSQPVSPASTTTYTMTCTGAGGSASASTTVTIVQP